MHRHKFYSNERRKVVAAVANVDSCAHVGWRLSRVEHFRSFQRYPLLVNDALNLQTRLSSGNGWPTLALVPTKSCSTGSHPYCQRLADWLQHLMEPTNSGAVVSQALLRHSSCVIACELHQNWFEWQRGFTGRQGKNKRSLLPVYAAPAVHRGVL